MLKFTMTHPFPTVIHWFRRDLRLTDNTALHHAVQAGAEVVPVYIASNWQGEHRWTGAPRQEFLCGSLAALGRNIESAGGRLILRRGRVLDELLGLIQETGAQAVFTNRDPDPYGIAMENTLAQKLAGAGVELLTFKDCVLHERAEILTGSGTPYRVFTPYGRNWHSLAKQSPWPAVKRLHTRAGLATLPPLTTASWGLDPCTADIVQPGEKAARQRLRTMLDSTLLHYAECRNLPHGRTTSRLSQDLRYGTLGIREIWQRAAGAMAAAETAAARKSAQTYLTELAWREFYMQVLWHWPEVFEHEFDPQWRGLPWSYDQERYERWRSGTTGFPIVDAGMRELLATGFMHNRVRMITAMFLTKDLRIDWRLGESWFMQALVDGEIASNNGGWQWSAGTGADAAPYFRIQNPWSQTKSYDPAGDYIRQWVPELKGLHGARFCEPPAPGLTLAKGYPTPMVDHAREREATMAFFKAHRSRTQG